MQNGKKVAFVMSGGGIRAWSAAQGAGSRAISPAM